MDIFHNYMNKDLKQQSGAIIEKFYYCPHHPKGTIIEFSIECNCRKPKEMLFQKAILDFSIDTSCSIVISNNFSDIIPAINNSINKCFLLNDNQTFNKSDISSSKIKIVNNWEEIIKYFKENIS